MTPGKMAVYWSFAMWVGFMGGALALLGGCSGADGNSELFASQSPSSPNEPNPNDPSPPCVSQGCASDEATFGTQASCTSSGRTCRAQPTGCNNTTVWCGRLTPRCTAAPACDADDEEVTTCPKGASCYSRSACGTTILCQRPFANCDAYPSCDFGDVKALDETTCKKAGACYSRTLCGTTIWCVDKT